MKSLPNHPKVGTSLHIMTEAHQKGHRQRLRERFVQGGADAMPDYELLELLLFQSIPRRDVKPLAKLLIQKYGSLAGVLNAPLDQLSQEEGIQTTTAAALKTVQVCAQRLLRQDVTNQPIFSNWQRLLDYCHAMMAHEKAEQFRILFVNRKNELIADEVQGRGTVDHTPVYPREVVKRALELGATALILVHNHPSGDTTPSKADIEMTRAIVKAAEAIDIIVHDHLIVSRKGHTSFKTEGLL